MRNPTQGFQAILAVVIGCTVASGCVLARPVFNEPSRQRVRIVADSPATYTVKVNAEGGAEVGVPSDGRVVIDIPQLPRECSRYFLGIKVTDGSPQAARVIHIIRNGHVVKRLSLNDLDQITADADGWRPVALR